MNKGSLLILVLGVQVCCRRVRTSKCSSHRPDLAVGIHLHDILRQLIDPKKTLAQIIHTNDLESKLEVGISYWDCFKGLNFVELRLPAYVSLDSHYRAAILLVSLMIFVFGETQSNTHVDQANNSPQDNSSYFFEQIGLDSETIYSLNLGGTAIGLVGILLTYAFVMPHFGRRTIYLGGYALIFITLLLIGILNVWSSDRSIKFGQAGLCLFWILIQQMIIGLLGWAIPAEVGSTRLRQKTIVVARNSYYVVNVICNVLQPYFMNPNAWNLSGYTGKYNHAHEIYIDF